MASLAVKFTSNAFVRLERRHFSANSSKWSQLEWETAILNPLLARCNVFLYHIEAEAEQWLNSLFSLVECCYSNECRECVSMTDCFVLTPKGLKWCYFVTCSIIQLNPMNKHIARIQNIRLMPNGHHQQFVRSIQLFITIAFDAITHQITEFQELNTQMKMKQ